MSKPQQDIQRWKASAVIEALSARRVVILAGTRQCGKTTLARGLGSTSAANLAIYRTLDDVALLTAALADPHGFVAHGDELMIIDEIQRAPVLLQAIKKDVDENRNLGRFLLTGSANIQSIPSVNESLAGRVAKERLRPFAEGELAGNGPQFFSRVLQEDWTGLPSTSAKDDVITKAMRGGYPEVQPLKANAVRRWHLDYVEAMMERDLRDIANIRHKDSMMKLLQVLAAWSSKLMDISSICSELSLARGTLETYVNALETLFLIDRVRPWHKTDYDRVGKQEKLFMSDTGLMASLLRWQFDKVRLDADQSGKLVEAFVYTQLVAQLEAQEELHELTHYRDRERREIDFVVETPDGTTIGIEVKAGSAVNTKTFQHLVWFRDNLIKDRCPFLGIVLYTGEHPVRFGSGLWAVPMSVLWG
jgi:uncharacterized protein